MTRAKSLPSPIHFRGETRALCLSATERPCIARPSFDELHVYTVGQYVEVLNSGGDRPMWALRATPVHNLTTEPSEHYDVRIIDPGAYEVQMLEYLGLSYDPKG